MNNQELNNHYINSQEQNDQNIDLNTGSFYTDDQKAGMPETVHAVVQNGPDKRKHKKRWLSISITIVICIIGSALGRWAASSFAQKAKKDQWEQEMQQRLDQLDESVPEIGELGGLSEEFVQDPIGSVSQADQEVMEQESAKEPQDILSDVMQAIEPTSADSTFQAERGVIADGIYRNEGFKLAFPLEEGMFALSDEEILQTIGMTGDSMAEDGMLTVEEWEQLMDGEFYDVVIKDANSVFNLSVLLSNMDILYGRAEILTEDLVAEAGEFLTENGYEVGEPYTRIIGGQEYICINVRNGELRQTGCLRMQGNYLISLYLTGAEGMEQRIEDYLDSFIIVE